MRRSPLALAELTPRRRHPANVTNGLLWGDDSAVVDLRATKRWGPTRPGVEVEVRAS